MKKYGCAVQNLRFTSHFMCNANRDCLVAGDLEHITEHETPPMTPLSLSNASPSMSVKREQRKSVGSISSGTKQSVKKVTPESFDFLFVI